MNSVSLVDGHIDGSERCAICGRDIPEGRQVCVICGKVPNKVKTNYDRIRNMSIEELARFMNECGHDFPPYCEYIKAASGRCDQNCIKCAREWLEAEVTE